MEPVIRSLEEIKEQNGYLIYNRDVVHKHSRAVGDLLNLVLHHIDDAFEQGRKGRPLMWIGQTFFSQLVYACDVTPLNVSDMARVCDPKTIDAAVDYFQIPQETCAMVKAVMGQFYKYKDSPCKRIVFPGTRCEPELTALPLLDHCGYDIHLLDMLKYPVNGKDFRKEMADARIKEEFRRVCLWLTGKEPDLERLREEQVRANRVHDKLDRLLELQRKHPGYIKTLPMMLALSGRECYYGQPERYEAIIDALIKELQSLPEGAYDDKMVKLVWSGARGVDFSVYNAVDVCGAGVSGWCIPVSGKHRFDTTIDPMEAMLRYSVNGRSVTSQGNVFKKVLETYEESGSQGVIIYMMLGCTFNTINAEMRRRYVSEHDIPTLSLAGTAQVGEATGQVMTRLKAFVEMLS